MGKCSLSKFVCIYVGSVVKYCGVKLVHASVFLVDPPIGKSACDAPASAFLRSVKDHS